MRTFLVSYATPRFEAVRSDLIRSAVENNIVNILSYDEEYLHQTDFYLQNKDLLDEICGAGYWAWKPYFILEALKLLRDNDILFYCDAGSAFISSPKPLIYLCATNSTGVVLFDARPLTNRQFTKRECFVRMGCDEPEHWNAHKVIATVLLLRRTEFALQLANEWLRFAQDRAIIADGPSSSGLSELDGFLLHRCDQSILSVLASKYRIETYRNPTLWGNYLKMPEFRVPGEAITSPYGVPPAICTYSDTPQANSPYGCVFEINRMPNYVGKPPLPWIPATVPSTPAAARRKRFSFRALARR